MTNATVGSAELAHLLAKTREADAHGPGALSTGEALAAALILNRADWLMALDYTIAQALERVGSEWAKLIPAAASQFRKDKQEAEYQESLKAHHAQLEEFSGHRTDDQLRFQARYITSGNAPGYRDVFLTFDLTPLGEGPKPVLRATLSIKPDDGEKVVGAVLDVHRFAWRKGTPIDKTPGEARPAWIERP